MLFSRAFIASALAALASTQETPSIPPIVEGTTTISGAQETKLAPDFVSYIASLKAQPAFTSVASEVQSVIAGEILASFENDPTADAFPIPTGTNSAGSIVLTATPSAWVTALPSDAQSYISSVQAVASSLQSKDLKGPAPTNRPMGVAAGVVAAGVGVVAMAL